MYDKRKDELDPELLEKFNPFLTCKTLSYYNNGEYCNYVNQTLNSYSGILPSREMEFRFYENMIVPMKRRRFDYIKKPKLEKEKEQLSPPDFFSKRELALYENMNKYVHE